MVLILILKLLLIILILLWLLLEIRLLIGLVVSLIVLVILRLLILLNFMFIKWIIIFSSLLCVLIRLQRHLFHWCLLLAIGVLSTILGMTIHIMLLWP